MIQDRSNDDHLDGVKQKEKATALFNEMVRIGEEQEKQQEGLQ
jgi:hypothetical protein